MLTGLWASAFARVAVVFGIRHMPPVRRGRVQGARHHHAADSTGPFGADAIGNDKRPSVFIPHARPQHGSRAFVSGRSVNTGSVGGSVRWSAPRLSGAPGARAFILTGSLLQQPPHARRFHRESLIGKPIENQPLSLRWSQLCVRHKIGILPQERLK